MKISEWLRPGVGVKRWISLAIVGMFVTGFGCIYLFSDVWWNSYQAMLASFLIAAGLSCFISSILYGTKRLLKIASSLKKKSNEITGKDITDYLYNSRVLLKGPKIVTIGGGTALSTMLRGLKNVSANLTALVTVADNGGGSGVLREELGMLPPGDIRNCILALSEAEPLMGELLQFRFNEGRLKGQSFGNLFLAALDGISTDFNDAVNKMSELLAITGKVLPITTENINLVATLSDKSQVIGESEIPEVATQKHEKIVKIELSKKNAVPTEGVIEAIREADLIIIGPGSLYTSIIPNLLVKGVVEEIKKSKAPKLYVCNIMSQGGETSDYSATDHIDAIEKHAYKGMIDYCLVNKARIPKQYLDLYKEEGQSLIKYNKSEIESKKIKVIERDLAMILNGRVRHDTTALSKSVIEILKMNGI